MTAEPSASMTAEPSASASASAPGTSPPAGGFDPSTISGDLKLAGFSAGNVEDKILQTVLDKFMAKYPNIKVTFEVIAGEYAPVMLTRLGSGDAPDLFYVQQGYAQDWVKQGVLEPLDTMAAERGFDTAKFFPGFLLPFQADGKTYGFPKDSSVLAMQTNDAMFTAAGVTPPTTIDELVTTAKKLKDGGVATPMCFTNEYARAGAIIESFGGGMLTEDLSASAIDSPESKAAVEWILTQVKDGLALRPKTDMGVDWCGQAFGEQKVAIAFEGNWIGPYMETTFPDVKYTVSAIPMQAEQATLSFTAAYAMSPDSKNKDASWVLLDYLTGQEGMQEWVNGGLVLPARDDVQAQSDRQKQYVAFAAAARPGEGLIPGWNGIQDAFNGALDTAIDAAKGGTVDADSVINAAKPAVDTALANQ